MKRLLALCMLLSVPLMLYLVVDASARRYALSSEAKRLEGVQAAWVDENRRLLSNIAIAKGRARTGEALRDAPGFVSVTPGRTLRIRIVPGLGRVDG